ncbi:hypothetical protein [Pseudomonas fluorescens]|uniref:hypothetical protein n=1 Tax=Pseudomonas fluorescens TaxID=294 RepID=UPI001242AEE9|nr:hypothetical protein [Pseudomonas fluorescens]
MLVDLPAPRLIGWQAPLQQIAITRFCMRPTLSLSDPTHRPSLPKSATPKDRALSEKPKQRVFGQFWVGFRQIDAASI